MALHDDWDAWSLDDDQPSPMSLDDCAVDLFFIAEALADHGMRDLADRIKREIVPLVDAEVDARRMPAKVERIADVIKAEAKKQSKKASKKARALLDVKVSKQVKPVVELVRAQSPKKGGA